MNSCLISIMGAPCSGKSTLATSVHTELKKLDKNSIFISEAATDYIAEFGLPDSPLDQLIIFYKQLEREKMYIGSKEYIICDSSTLLNYFYFRSLFDNKLSNKDIATINHLQKEILKTINSWSHIFYVPPILNNVDDGIRFHKKDDILKIDNQIKSYLQIENINYTDCSNVDLNERIDYIIKKII